MSFLSIIRKIINLVCDLGSLISGVVKHLGRIPKRTSSTLSSTSVSEKDSNLTAEETVLKEGSRFLRFSSLKSDISLVIPILFNGKSLLVFINPRRTLESAWTLSIDSIDYESKPFSDLLGFEVEVKKLFKSL